MIGVRWVEYGRPAAEALRAAIADAKGDDPLAPVSVVVPSNHVGVAARRLLAGGALGPVCGRGIGVAGVTFLTVYRVAELLGAPDLAAARRRPVSTPVIAAGLRAALAADPGVFRSVSAHPATEAALVAAYRELRDLPAAALDAIGRRSLRAADVVRLHRAARAWLAPAWYDEEDLMASAAEHRHAVSSLGTLVVYLPQRLTRHAAALLRALGDDTTMTVLAGTTGAERADAEVRRAVDLLSPQAEVVPPSPVGAPYAPGRTRVVSTSDAEEEVRLAVRAVVDAARAGTPLDRIALLHPGFDPYPQLFHEQLAVAGIGANGPAALPLTARVAGRALLDLIDLPEGGYRREDVFAWLASAPIRFNGSVVPATAWERISRQAGVVSGVGEWDERLVRLATELEASAATADSDQPDWRSQRDAEEARRARNLRRFALDLIEDLQAATAAPRRWAEHATWARGHLARLGPTDRWPAEEIDAAGRVGRAIDRLAALDEIDGPVSMDVFGRTLRLELEADLGRIGRFGRGVFVAPVAMGVGLDVDLAVVVGLAEGSLPGPVHEDSLLPDHERRAELPLARDRTDRQHRWLLASLAGAAQQVLSFPRGDLRRSTERVPSRWLLEARSVVAGGDREDEPSFDAGLRRLTFPATAQEHRLRSALSGPLSDRIIAAGTEMVVARRGHGFTRFDGNLAGAGVAAPEVTSASRLERWVKCPFAYLMGDVLGVEAIDKPEDHLQIAPMVKGELVHAVLERFIVEVLARPQPPAPDDPWTEEDRALLGAFADELCDDYAQRGLTGRPIFWDRERARLDRELTRFLAEDSAQRQRVRSTPLAAELAFGVRGAALPAVPFPLPGGGVVRFRGKADRVDVTAGGALHVMDYKTGKPEGYTKLGPDDPDLGGTKLQLPIYALAARLHYGTPDAPVRAEYWFVSQRGDFKRIGYDVAAEVIDAVGARLEAVLEGISHGVFPNHPRALSTATRTDCPWCDPDGLGETDLQRRWLRKRADPAVARYVEMVDA